MRYPPLKIVAPKNRCTLKIVARCTSFAPHNFMLFTSAEFAVGLSKGGLGSTKLKGRVTVSDRREMLTFESSLHGGWLSERNPALRLTGKKTNDLLKQHVKGECIKRCILFWVLINCVPHLRAVETSLIPNLNVGKSWIGGDCLANHCSSCDVAAQLSLCSDTLSATRTVVQTKAA